MLPLAVLAVLTVLTACGGGESPGSESAQDAGPPVPTSFGNITRERLLAADSEPEQWMTSGRDFGKSHYSTLDQINLENIDRLGFAWEYHTNTTRGLQATPIVVDGVLYTSGTTGRAYALNAATGEEIWAFDPQNDGQVNRYACCDEVNRGVAVWEGMVYVASLDGRLFGLDAESGDVVWEADTFIYKDRGYTSTGAPEVAGDVVVIGNGGADYDARGYVSAYHLKTGELAWRFFIVPGDPELGFEHPEMEYAAQTWDPNSRWDVGGGGTAWNGMSYDPELNLLYVGTGNSALFNWRVRSPAGGDNLFLVSILAINPDNGELVWYYQQVPHDGWDYTATQPMILADIEFQGEMRKVLMQAPKVGFFYILDRETGELLSADPYVPVNWASHVDLETGRPVMIPENYDYKDGPVFIVPSGMGGHSWNPMAFNPENGLVYIPAIEGGAITYDPNPDGHVYRPMQPNSGNSTLFGNMLLADPDTMAEPMRSVLRRVQEAGEHHSRAALKAFDPHTGEVVWEQETAGYWDRGGVLATAGGLVFQTADTGHLRAYHADTGEQVMEIEVGTSMLAAPMTYMVDGVQYIAVMAAWGGGGWFAPHDTSAVVRYGNDGRILAFRLDGGETPLPEPLEPPGPIPEPPARMGDAAAVAEGGALFRRHCAICHANVDHGMTPDLRRMSADTHAGFHGIVLHGSLRYRSMPQWDDVLDARETDAIHAYLIDLAWEAHEAQQ